MSVGLWSRRFSPPTRRVVIPSCRSTGHRPLAFVGRNFAPNQGIGRILSATEGSSTKSPQTILETPGQDRREPLHLDFRPEMKAKEKRTFARALPSAW